MSIEVFNLCFEYETPNVAPCPDMNPAHIIRECLTDKEWGMGYNEADIDDVSFTAAADTLFDEEMGISILWQRENTIEAFVQDIVRHIDAALYVDRRTGKFVLKLIRDDYTPAFLVTLGPDQIERVENYKRPAFGDLVNSVTVIYEECDDGRQLVDASAGSSGPQCIRWKMCEKTTDDNGNTFLVCGEVFGEGSCITDIKNSATQVYGKEVTEEEVRADMVERLQSFIGCEQVESDNNGDPVTYTISSISAGEENYLESAYGPPIDVIFVPPVGLTGTPNKEIRYYVTGGIWSSDFYTQVGLDTVECEDAS